MSTAIITRTYEGLPVTFDREHWVNATEMGKRFGKPPAQFLRLPSTKDWLGAYQSLPKVMCENHTSLFRVVRGVRSDGQAQGTWMHPLLGVEFARWLSPRFAIWTNMVILELMSARPALPPAKSAALVQVSIEERYWKALNRYLWEDEYGPKSGDGCSLRVNSVKGTPDQFASFLSKKMRQPVAAEWMGRALHAYVRTLPAVVFFQHRRQRLYTITRPLVVGGKEIA